MKRYIIKKYIEAESLVEALKIEKKREVNEIIEECDLQQKSPAGYQMNK